MDEHTTRMHEPPAPMASSRLPHDDTSEGSPRERLVAASGLAERHVEVAGIDTAILEGGQGPPIPDLNDITTPTSLVHGRHDLQVDLALAQGASRALGWPLHVVDDARDDPAAECPEQFVAALRAAVARPGASTTTTHGRRAP